MYLKAVKYFQIKYWVQSFLEFRHRMAICRMVRDTFVQKHTPWTKSMHFVKKDKCHQKDSLMTNNKSHRRVSTSTPPTPNRWILYMLLNTLILQTDGCDEVKDFVQHLICVDHQSQKEQSSNKKEQLWSNYKFLPRLRSYHLDWTHLQKNIKPIDLKQLWPSDVPMARFYGDSMSSIHSDPLLHYVVCLILDYQNCLIKVSGSNARVYDAYEISWRIWSHRIFRGYFLFVRHTETTFWKQYKRT